MWRDQMRDSFGLFENSGLRSSYFDEGLGEVLM
jgi:hypothetical protein